MTLLLVFAAITAAFGIWLAVKSLVGWRICAICLAFVTVWASLFAAYRAGWFANQALLALLMGMSVMGLYHMAEKRLPEAWLPFRLPALLTLVYIFYTALTWQIHLYAGLFLGSLWLLFGTILVLKTRPAIRQTVKRLIECCGSW